MNYRHGFHAGNFADLAKHAALLTWLKSLRDGPPVLVVDTHAGAGLYDLSNQDFARSKEAEAGIKYLLGGDVPDSLEPLAGYVRAKNAHAGFRDRVGLYPGSPLIVVDHLRAEDGYIGCELRSDDFALLRSRIEPRGRAMREDGYAVAAGAADDPRDLFYLIDPPFEAPDDYDRITATLGTVLARRPEASALVWLPLKDLETFDAWLRGMERMMDGLARRPALTVAELRLRPLWNPMKMNGCVLAAINPPAGYSNRLDAIARDVVAVFGDAGGLARTRTF